MRWWRRGGGPHGENLYVHEGPRRTSFIDPRSHAKEREEQPLLIREVTRRGAKNGKGVLAFWSLRSHVLNVCTMCGLCGYGMMEGSVGVFVAGS